MEHLHRDGADPLLALGDPPVARIARILREQRQRSLIGADRPVRPPARGDPCLRLGRRPLPRPAAGECSELADQPLPLADQPHAQPPGLLLAPPAPASPPAAPPPAGPAPRRPRRPAPAAPGVPPQRVPLPTCARSINRPPNATDPDATSCHPAQPGAGNPETAACPAPATPRQAADGDPQPLRHRPHAARGMMHLMQLRALLRSVAVVWRRSWSRIGRRFARIAMRSNDRARFRGSTSARSR